MDSREGKGDFPPHHIHTHFITKYLTGINIATRPFHIGEIAMNQMLKLKSEQLKKEHFKH